jgi:hypothetical protein
MTSQPSSSEADLPERMTAPARPLPTAARPERSEPRD